MCGIAGFYGFRNDNLIRSISTQLSHRGPDGEGFHIDDTITLLNRRLAIIDRKGGDQPIYNEDKSIVVVYNGEIYNYLDLRKDLESNGHVFSTHSDTEVIVHGYEQWGEDCFDQFNGMFAIALYDLKKKTCVLARDHFGIKPLYYSKLPNKSFIFSSEIKPIIQSGLISKEPNDSVIFRYLKYRVHDDKEETFFKGIKRIMPGQRMIISKDDAKTTYFSKLETETYGNSKNISPKKFYELLQESVRARLMSEVPVGTCLSGGLDSSTVVAIINKLLNQHVKDTVAVGPNQNTFSAVFPGSTNDEEKYIDEVLKQSNLVRSHKIYPKPEGFFEDLEDFVKTQEEPTISTGPYAQYKVMQEAHKHVTVLLDGQGADEMMAGYVPYYAVFFKELMKKKDYKRLITELTESGDIISRLVWQKIQNKMGLKKSVNPVSVLDTKFLYSQNEETFAPINTDLKGRLKQDVFHNSLQSLLRYEDRNTMRFSIEGRVPFLDLRVFKYLFNLDSSAIIQNGWNKKILRNAMKGILPDLIVNRRNKIGFTTPEHEWFMKMKNRIYRIFLSESFGKRKYFNQASTLKAFREFVEGKNDDTMLFWRLINLELWLRIFFDEKPKGKTQRKPEDPNEGKKITISIDTTSYSRYPIKTDIFKKNDDYPKKITSSVEDFLPKLLMVKDLNHLGKKPWFVVVSEKIIAISQGRSYFIWDIKPGLFAKILSTFVKRTPFGIGLGSPWTMQLAIQEVGLPRILLASVLSIFTKPFGVKGIFYHIAGREIAAIDGPTEYSVYPSNVSAKLAPKDPEKAANQIHEQLENSLSPALKRNFAGVVIIDANDIGQNIMGNSTTLPDGRIRKIFSDNPMGQADEQTPLVAVFET